MGFFKWVKNTFFGGDVSSQKKKKKNSGGGGGGSSSSSSPRMVDSSTFTKSYQAYKKGAEKRKSQEQKSKSVQKKAEDNWGNVFSRGTIWTNATKSTNVDHSKIANPIKDTLDKKAKESTEKKYHYKSFADKAQDSIKKALTEGGDKTSPRALSGKGEGMLNKAVKKAIKSQETYEKFMGDDKKTNAQKKLEQKIGDVKRGSKELEYESKYHPKSLYAARRFASGVTLGGEKVLEKHASDDVKKALKKDDRVEKEDWIKLSDDEKREQKLRGLHGKIDVKGISGKAIGEVAEIAGNMATFGATSSLTKGVGEKGLNRIAKLTKTGETAQEALEKSKFVQKLAKGSPDKAKDIASKLANGLAEDYGINKTTGAVQSAIDASIKKSEDKDSSWGKEFAKNQALNMATGGATELGLSVLRNRKARKEAAALLSEQGEKAEKTLSAKAGEENAVETLAEKDAKKNIQNKSLQPQAAEANAQVQKAVKLENNPAPGETVNDSKADPFSSFQADDKTKKRLLLNHGGTNTTKKEYIEKNYDKVVSEVNPNNGKTYFFVKDENGKRHAINKEQHEYAQHLKALDSKPVETGAVENAAVKEPVENAATNRAAELTAKSEQLNKERTTVVSQMKELEGKHSAMDLADNDEYINLRNKLESIDDERFDTEKELKKHTSATQEPSAEPPVQASATSNEPSTQSLDEIKARKAAIQNVQNEHLDAVKRGEQEIDVKGVTKREEEFQNLTKQEKSIESGETNQNISEQENIIKGGNESASKAGTGDGTTDEEVIELKKRGLYGNSTDAMLDRAEISAKDGTLPQHSNEEDVHVLAKTLDLDNFNKDNALDKMVIDLKDDYIKAVEREDTEEAERLANEVIRTYNARQYANDYGTQIAERALTGKKATMEDMNFHIPSADELRVEVEPKATTLQESNEFSKQVDYLNERHELKSDGKKTGKTVKTMYNNAQSDEAREILGDSATKGYLDTYRKHTKRDAKRIIEDVVQNPDAIARELQSYLDETKGFYGKDQYIAMLKAQSLYAYCTRHVAENEGFQKGLAISSNYIAEYGGLAGNTMNAMSIFASCSPQRQMATLKQKIINMGKERGLSDEEVNKALEHLEPLYNDYIYAKTQKEKDVIAAKITTAASKMYGNKGIISTINTLRHFAMLSSPKTQARNIIGNVVFAGERAISDVIARQIQNRYLKKGIIEYKTKGKLSFNDTLALFNKATNADAKMESMNKYLKTDVDIILGTTEKYGDVQKYFYENDSAFVKAINKASDVVSTGLELGDKPFISFGYKKGYMQFMNANGFNQNEEMLLKKAAEREDLVKALAEVRGKIKETKDDNLLKTLRTQREQVKLDLKLADSEIKKLGLRKSNLEKEARNFARKEAEEATYRDANEFAEMINNIKRRARKKDASVLQKGMGVTAEGSLPYTNTPANVTKQGVRFSPVGLLMNGVKFRNAIKAENPDTRLINELAEKVAGGITGTGVFAIGAYLGANTIMNAVSMISSIADDPKGYYKKSLGYQEYSAIVGKKGDKHSISLEWLTPTASALFFGVSAGEYMQKIGDATAYSGSMWDHGAGGLKVISDVFEPVFETSMISTFSDILDGANSDSETNPLINIATTLGESAVSSMFPNILKNGASTLRPYDYSSITQSESEGGKALERWSNNLRNSIKISDSGNAKTDSWGNISGKRGNIAASAFDSFLNPAKIKKVTESKTDRENMKLYDELVKSGVKEEQAQSVLPNTEYKNKITVGGKKVDLDSVDVSLINQARAKKSGAKEALRDLVLQSKTFNEKGKLSDKDREKLLNKDFKNTKEVVKWLHGTKAWEKANNEERQDMQELVLGQGNNSNGRQTGSVSAGMIDVYKRHGKTEVDYRYDNEVKESARDKLNDLAKTQEGKQKALDFANGARNGIKNTYPQATMLPYLNDAVASGKLTEKEAAALFDAYKAAGTKTSYYYGKQPSSGGRRGYRRRYYRRGYYRRGYSRRGRSGGGGGGSSSAGVGKVVQLKTAAFNPTVTSSDYKSWASSSSSKSSKSTKIKSQINNNNSAPKVKAPDPIIKTKKKS